MAAPISAASTTGLAADGRGVNALKLQANNDDPSARRAALAQASRQLESLFMRELLKSMRESSKQLNADSGGEGGLATDLFDQQMSVQMAGQPGGLASMIERELSRQVGASRAASVPASATAGLDKSTFSFAGAAPIAPSRGRDDFVQQHRAAAERVARASGIPAAFMLGQAGHETGWGKSAIRTADGGNSYNLFGIKATGGWDGKVAAVTTTEYVDGAPRTVVAKFRAYDSYEESFRDYARLITENPRYEKALAKVNSVQGWAAELQRAGYATDPNYASKLSRAIQSTMAVAGTSAGTQA